MKNPPKKEVKEERCPNEECPKDIDAANVAASSATSNNGSACRYMTQGTIASIDLMGKTFTIDPVSPYLFEQKKGDNTEKSIIFISESEDKRNENRDAKMLASHQVFALPDKIDLGTIVALKNGRDKIELAVDSFAGTVNAVTKENTLNVASFKMTK